VSSSFEPLTLPHYEDRDAPIVFADACLGGGPMMGDNITLTFGTKFLDHSQSPPASCSKTVLRLVLPVFSAAATADFIEHLLADLRSAAAACDSEVN